MTEAQSNPPTRAVVELLASDLPAFCPNPRMSLWNHHPKVFLDLTGGHPVSCAYCGTRYRLRDGEKVHRH